MEINPIVKSKETKELEDALTRVQYEEGVLNSSQDELEEIRQELNDGLSYISDVVEEDSTIPSGLKYQANDIWAEIFHDGSYGISSVLSVLFSNALDIPIEKAVNSSMFNGVTFLGVGEGDEVFQTFDRLSSKEINYNIFDQSLSFLRKIQGSQGERQNPQLYHLDFGNLEENPILKNENDRTLYIMKGITSSNFDNDSLVKILSNFIKPGDLLYIDFAFNVNNDLEATERDLIDRYGSDLGLKFSLYNWLKILHILTGEKISMEEEKQNTEVNITFNNDDQPTVFVKHKPKFYTPFSGSTILTISSRRTRESIGILIDQVGKNEIIWTDTIDSLGATLFSFR